MKVLKGRETLASPACISDENDGAIFFPNVDVVSCFYTSA